MPNAWAIIRVLGGLLRYQVFDPASEIILGSGHLGFMLPNELRRVALLGPMQIGVEFYTQLPEL
jgi:hypothetical protein